jgi:hypothetical protein
MSKFPCASTEHHAMKAYWESGSIASRILDLGTRWRWVVSFTPRPLYHQGKSPWYPLDRRLGGPQSRSGRGDEEKNSQPLSRLELPIIHPVAQRYTNELEKVYFLTVFLKDYGWNPDSHTILVTCHVLTSLTIPREKYKLRSFSSWKFLSFPLRYLS